MPSRRRVHSLARLVVVALLLAVAMPSGAEELASLLQRIEAAYGAVGKLTTIRQSGRTVSRLRGEGTMERLWAAPDRFRIRLGYASETEVRSMAAGRAWQGSVDKSGPFLQAMQLQAARSQLPWNLMAIEHTALLGSRIAEDGSTVHTLVLVLESPLRLLVEVDDATARVLRSIGTGIGDMQFITEYRDFRHIGGHLVATREEHYAMGRHIGHSIIEQLDFPADPGDGAFLPPQ